MRRVSMAFGAALFTVVACGGTSSTSGSAGGGGTSSSGGGGGSSGKLSITFTVEGPGTYCNPIACLVPQIQITDVHGETIVLESSCGDRDCSTCNLLSCPASCGTPLDRRVTGARLDWDGSYYMASTCGAGQVCSLPSIVPPGRYTATFCATPGTITTSGTGSEQCAATGPPKCGTATFDFPSTAPVSGTVGA